MNKYLVLSRNEKIEAQHTPAGSTILLHVDRWNGSYEVTVTSVEVKADKALLVDNTGQRHTVPVTMPVWIRERTLVAGVE